MKKKYFLIVLTAIIIVVAFIFFFVSSAVNSKPDTAPVFFDLDDSTADFSIKKTDNTDPNYPNYWVVRNTRHTYEVLVGNSKVELDSFVGKKIVIKGNYSGRVGNQQCIVNKCHPIGGKSAMIDIDSIQEVE